MELNRLTAHELVKLLNKGDISPTDICNSIISSVEKIDPKINALAHFDKDIAISRCKTLAKKDQSSSLYGIPVFIKDNICVKDELTTCASKILQGFRSPYNATVIDKLLQAKTVLMGKTNMDEFAFGSSTETSCYGPTKNPWDLKRIPGGSSGGSASSVAADEAIFALGSDTGGSIRQPASLCGIVGLKPTYGRVSRYGLIAFASSLDQIGTLTKDVEDAALLLKAISGHDTMDSTSGNIPVPDYVTSSKKDIKGLKIGIPKEYFIKGMDPEVKKAILVAIKKLESLGARCEDISLPHTEYAVAVYYLVATAEASSNLARFDGVQYGLRDSQAKSVIEMHKKTRKLGFGDEAKRRIILGTFALSSGYYDAYYSRALKVRTLIKKDFEQAFKKYDCIVTPTSPTPAFKIGEKIQDPLTMYLSDIFTISANLAGIPGISVPCGFTKDNLPIGLQILGKGFDEETILRVAYNYEQSTEWHKQKPKL
ncbi:MAG: Asp-tRNA(Asn)/Glu-tRNA(Gln) amidotransferase subunit GatA [Candidatus Omnitrophota bacterium]|jgi:aspartyl-tRNA(Asn)/glutamyl-tRNA(Gln) amidotransferase subunit A|nr:Asp-tRNA(Asn)/Glu-tRNA(Gln) amidotransferase subunit GatA [Candidatus Omnitrophota bacterium]